MRHSQLSQESITIAEIYGKIRVIFEKNLTFLRKNLEVMGNVC